MLQKSDWFGMGGSRPAPPWTTPEPLLPQTVETRVSSLSIGAEFLYRVTDRLAVGAGVYEIRWAVHSTERVSPAPGGAAATSGTSIWWRLGLGPVHGHHPTLKANP